MKTKAICHPDRPHFCKGECRSCYYKARYTRKSRSEYHIKHRERDNARQRKRDRNFYAETKAKLSKSDFSLYLERHHLRRYGFKWSEIDRIITLRKNGICEICGRTPNPNEKLHIDHCHSSKKFRGFLCAACNRGLGCFDDNHQRLIEAAKYLLGFKNKLAPCQ